jgi:hypothetical protein
MEAEFRPCKESQKASPEGSGRRKTYEVVVPCEVPFETLPSLSGNNAMVILNLLTSGLLVALCPVKNIRDKFFNTSASMAKLCTCLNYAHQQCSALWQLFELVPSAPWYTSHH